MRERAEGGRTGLRVDGNTVEEGIERGRDVARTGRSEEENGGMEEGRERAGEGARKGENNGAREGARAGAREGAMEEAREGAREGGRLLGSYHEDDTGQ